MKLDLAHDHPVPTGVLGLAVSADGTRAVATCADGTVRSVDLATGALGTLDAAHASFASGCVLLPDGRTAVSAGYDGMLFWHDLESGRCWRRLRAHRFWSWHLALSPDGRRLASVTGQYLAGGWKYEPAPETEPSVRIFDARTGDLLHAFPHVPPVLSAGNHRAFTKMIRGRPSHGRLDDELREDLVFSEYGEFDPSQARRVRDSRVKITASAYFIVNLGGDQDQSRGSYFIQYVEMSRAGKVSIDTCVDHPHRPEVRHV